VAGSNLASAPEPYIWMSNVNFLSPDSRCHSFDHRANGYARGEGIGVVVLKRLSDAIRDGNTIRAIVRSTASNEDGRTPGITQPSRKAQEKLIRETYRKAGLSMAHTRYFEAHGMSRFLIYPFDLANILTEDRNWNGSCKSGDLAPLNFRVGTNIDFFNCEGRSKRSPSNRFRIPEIQNQR
jgi:hypothetical protein